MACRTVTGHLTALPWCSKARHCPRAPLSMQEKRDAKLKEELEKFRAENPKISEQFADLKRKLADVPVEQVGRPGGGAGGAAHGDWHRRAVCGCSEGTKGGPSRVGSG